MKQTIKSAIGLPEPSRDRARSIGSILVEQGRLRADDVLEIRTFAEAQGIRFGDAAVKMRLLTRDEIDIAIAQQYSYPILQLGGDHGVADDVIAAYQPQSPMLEPLRALRSQLILRWFKGASRRVLVIASPERREGRSWLAANLATMFAQLGERTLLIDADMRHPSQHHMFRLNNSVGLSALLTGRAGREAAQRIHPQLRLFVLPSGIVPPNPQELLERDVFDVVLDLFAEQFGIVILDTPAAAETADAQILAAHAGASILVARRHHTRQGLLTSVKESFVQTGANVIGSVIVGH